MSPKTTDDPNRRDILAGLTAGVAATALPTTGAASPGGPPESPALAADAEALTDVIVDAWNAWLEDADFSDSMIDASTVEGGVLSSPVDVAVLVEDGLIVEGVTPSGASKLSVAVADAWEGWALDWSLPPSDAFPEFAAVAAPEAPETEGDPVALQPQTSAGWNGITAGLQGSLNAALAGEGPIKGTHSVAQLVQAIAWRVGNRVEGWSAQAMVEGIRGGGPVPTFAPPYVPVGPVVAGDNISTPGHLLNISPIPGGTPVIVAPGPPIKGPGQGTPPGR